MLKAYSDDLRCKLLEGYEAGAGSLWKLALPFRDGQLPTPDLLGEPR